MALLGTLFIGWLFRPLLPADQIESYIAGLILLAAAPCTAMVFAFALLVGLLLGVASIAIPWDTLLLSVVLYIVVPVIIAQVIRRAMLANGGQPALDALLRRLGPVSLTALLATLVLLFGFQGEAILGEPLVIALLVVPILIQVYFNAGLAYWLSRKFGVAWCVAAPAALIGASNFFELACCGRDQPVRDRLWSGVGDGGGRPLRGAGHAVGRRAREADSPLVQSNSLISAT